MADNNDDLARALKGETRRVQRLQTSIAMLERDIETVANGIEHRRYCVDFYDLRKYLSVGAIARPSSVGRDKRRIGEEKVTALLFNFLPSPPVLLPPHYREFVAFTQGLLGEFGGIAGRRQNLLANLRKTWQREMDGERGLLSLLERLSRTPSTGLPGELAARVERILVELERTTEQVAGAVAIVARFDFLHRTGRLIGWGDLTRGLPSVAPSEDEVFYKTLNLLGVDENRKDTSNIEDARALALIRLYNNAKLQQGKELFFVTGVSAMRNVVDVLNDTILPRFNERIELRDLGYWSLWFNALSRSSAGDGRVPEIMIVKEFCQSLLGPLREVERLSLEALQASRRKGGLGNRDKVEAALHRIDNVFNEIYEPILDGRLLLAEIYRGFEPIYEEKALSETLGKIRALLEGLKSPETANLVELGGALRSASRTLDEWITNVAGKVDDVLTRLGSQAEEFRLAFGWLPEPISSPYDEWLAELDSETVTHASAERILLSLASVSASEREGGFAWGLVQVRTLLVLGRITDAIATLTAMKGINRARPSVRLAEAAVKVDNGQLAAAEEILVDLESNYREPRIEIALARLRLMRYEETREITLLDAARLLGELVSARRDALSDELRNAALEIRVQSELLRPRNIRRVDQLAKLEVELVGMEQNPKIAELLRALQTAKRGGSVGPSELYNQDSGELTR